MALAEGRKPVDIGRLAGGSAKQTSQAFLLGDKRRVLRGGPWSFAKAHLALEDYDGISPLLKVPLNFVCFWVKIGNIPPAFEEPDTIALIASTVSSFLELDHKLFRKGEIRVRVRHDVTKPVLLSEVVRLAAGVEARPLFANLQQVTVPSKDKRAVVIRSLPDSFIPAMEVPSLTAPLLGKQGRLEVVSSSPKKLKLAMTCDKFSARSLGLAESDTGLWFKLSLSRRNGVGLWVQKIKPLRQRCKRSLLDLCA
ncbi:hypothetical protein M0R45_008550 [Rubus argutus]|uniref:DUF4283 domain-containing protein n=1 Tax=Rubus argutus TaxID=59490 RepID=A0AAW1Y1Y9_RUBAR